jgi:hypothetical protein
MFFKQKQSRKRRTEAELMALLKFIVGLCLAATLVGIVFAVLYSIIFVTQPLDAISPIDTKFFELIIPIATFLSGTLSGIMLGSPSNTPEVQQPKKETLPAVEATEEFVEEYVESAADTK